MANGKLEQGELAFKVANGEMSGVEQKGAQGVLGKQQKAQRPRVGAEIGGEICRQLKQQRGGNKILTLLNSNSRFN